MHSIRLLQAAALMFLAAAAASCAASKAYTSKLFAPREATGKDSTQTVIRFMDTGDAETNTADWVSTDFIMGRDSSGSSATLDQFAKTYPAGSVPVSNGNKNDSLRLTLPVKDTVLVKTAVTTEEPVIKAVSLTGKRNKKSRED